MDRRHFLAAALAGISGTAGCIDHLSDGDEEYDWPPEVNGDEPELTPGDETTLSIEAEEVNGLRLQLPDRQMMELDLSNATISPDPDGILGSEPPVWNWDSRESVEIEVPAQATEDAEPGSYPYTVTVHKGHSDDLERESFEFTITVVEE